VKKNLQESKRENLPEENARGTKQNGAGSRFLGVLIFVILLAVILVVMYLVSNYNNNTFRINNI